MTPPRARTPPSLKTPGRPRIGHEKDRPDERPEPHPATCAPRRAPFRSVCKGRPALGPDLRKPHPPPERAVAETRRGPERPAET